VTDCLDRVTRRLGVPGWSVLTAIFSRWEDLVGADIAAHAQPRSLRDGVLLIAVDQPAWAGQLKFMTADLIRRIHESVAGSGVTEIRIKVVGGGSVREGRKDRR
jgi:predicted nucleic acid-binding Zn ribbon protein